MSNYFQCVLIQLCYRTNKCPDMFWTDFGVLIMGFGVLIMGFGVLIMGFGVLIMGFGVGFGVLIMWTFVS